MRRVLGLVVDPCLSGTNVSNNDHRRLAKRLHHDDGFRWVFNDLTDCSEQ